MERPSNPVFYLCLLWMPWVEWVVQKLNIAIKMCSFPTSLFIQLCGHWKLITSLTFTHPSLTFTHPSIRWWIYVYIHMMIIYVVSSYICVHEISIYVYKLYYTYNKYNVYRRHSLRIMYSYSGIMFILNCNNNEYVCLAQ